MSVFKKNFSKNKISLVFFFLIILSYFLGFFLRENSAGGGPIDLEHEWNNYNLLKEDFLNFLNSNYEASRFPLFHYLNILIGPNITNKQDFILYLFLYSFLVPILFFFSVKLNFKYLSNYKIYLIISLIFLSPYFRTSSFWGLQENLAYIFLFLSLISYQSSVEIVKKYLTIIFAFLSFYADQKFLIVPIIYFLLFFSFEKKIFYNLKKNFLIIILSFFLTIPSLLIFYKWGGISGPGGNKSELRLENLIFFIHILSVYVIPVVFLQRNLSKEILKILEIKNLIIIVFFIIIYFIINQYFFVDGQILGGGWLNKIYFLLKKNNLIFAEVIFFFVSLFLFCILLIYLNIIKLDLIKSVILIYYVFLSVSISTIFQEYFDPIINLFIIFYLNKSFFHNLKFIKLIIMNLYYLIFLILSIMYRSL
jgi:hypothetical protein